MASAEIHRPAETQGPLSNPWPWTIGGVAAAGLAFLWVVAFKESLTPVRVLLVFGGVVAAGAAIAIKPKPQIILGGAAAAFLGALALYSGEGRSDHWDSIRLVLAVAAVVAALAALITALPKIPRRIFVSVFIVMHFMGILTAVTAAPPAPWLANVVWTYFYRPYLEFMYLNNAYHFYAPEPGPAFLFWFRIEYTVANDPQPARAFRYEHVAVWQPDDAPRMRESFRGNRNLDAGVSLRSGVGPRAITEFVCRLWRLRSQSHASGGSHANEENK